MVAVLRYFLGPHTQLFSRERPLMTLTQCHKDLPNFCSTVMLLQMIRLVTNNRRAKPKGPIVGRGLGLKAGSRLAEEKIRHFWYCYFFLGGGLPPHQLLACLQVFCMLYMVDRRKSLRRTICYTVPFGHFKGTSFACKIRGKNVRK